MGSVDFDFEGETAIVTGGSSGIGREIALQLADAGATVLVGDIREDPKDDSAEQPTHETITDRGGTASFVETDVSDPRAVADLVAEARAHGGVDVMVNNAGLQIPGAFREVTPEDLERLYAVNVKGMFFGCQAAADDMLDRDDPGVIVNTASISSNLAQHGQVAYDTTKGAVRMLTRGAALELADEGVRVNAVAPGQIATEFVDGWTDEAIAAAQEDEFLKPVPQGRAGYPRDVAGAVLFLASDAAEYVTGELLHVDGGWHVC